MKKKTRLRKIFFITIPSVFIFLFALELSLRLAGYLYVRPYYSDLRKKNQSNDFRPFNILCLGDSFTFGMGADSGHSYPRQLARLLREGISKDINVIDRGRGGNTSSLILKNFKEDIDRYHPDVIIVLVGINNEWNMESSSYFIINKKNLYFWKGLEAILDNFRLYKFLKIGWINIKSKFDKYKGHEGNGMAVLSKRSIPKINPDSMDVFYRGNDLFGEGKYDLSLEKFQEALIMDENNYEAYLGLAHIWAAYNKTYLAREAFWKAVYTINALDEWEENIYRITNQIICLRIDMRDKELECAKLKEYLRGNLERDKNKRLIEIIDAQVDLWRNQEIFDRVLEYDLEEIIRLAKENKIKVVLQTYPDRRLFHGIIRNISKGLNIPLVDNETIFQGIGKDNDITSFFVADGHCNRQGYRVIAGNVYNVLVNARILPDNLAGGSR